MRTYEDLLEEAYNNINEDRKSLKDTLDLLKKAARENPELLVKVAQSSVFIVDGLTKSNGQLVELVKTESRRNSKNEAGEISEEEADSMWDEIGKNTVSTPKKDEN